MSRDQNKINAGVAKEMADLRRRLNSMIMTGTAEANQGAKTKVRFEDQGANGEAFSSPFLAQASRAGLNGGGVSEFSKIGTGEPVMVISPGGEIGKHSRVMSAGHVEDFPSPGTAEEDGKVFRAGDATISIKNGEVTISCGSSSIVLKPGEIILTSASFKGVKA